MQTNYLPEPLTAQTDTIHCCSITRYDLPEFGKVIFEAWRSLDSQARSMDALCFPAWCHFELLDRDSNCIFTSEPELLGTDDSDIRSVKIPLAYDRSRHILPVTLSRRAWRPEVSTSDIPAELRDSAAKVIIYVRSAIRLPEWPLSAVRIVEGLSYNRVIMDPLPEIDERIFKSLNLSPQKPANIAPRCSLLTRRPRRVRRQRKMLHKGIRHISVSRSLPPPREPPHPAVPIISDG